jgi:DNA-binding protein Fis
LRSSKKSLNADIAITTNNGNQITGCPFVIDIKSTVSKYPTIKKYILAILENYSIKLRGKNVNNVYLHVLIVLSLNYSSGIFVIIPLSIGG